MLQRSQHSLLLSLLLSDSFLSLCDIREALKELRNFSLLLLPGRRTRRSTEAFRSLLSVPGKQLSVMTSYHFMHREPSSDGCDENEQFFWGADNDILSPALIYHRREWRASEMQGGGRRTKFFVTSSLSARDESAAAAAPYFARFHSITLL